MGFTVQSMGPSSGSTTDLKSRGSSTSIHKVEIEKLQGSQLDKQSFLTTLLSNQIKKTNSEPLTLSNLNLRNQLQLEQKVKKSLGTGGSLINLKVKSGK